MNRFAPEVIKRSMFSHFLFEPQSNVHTGWTEPPNWPCVFVHPDHISVNHMLFFCLFSKNTDLGSAYDVMRSLQRVGASPLTS